MMTDLEKLIKTYREKVHRRTILRNAIERSLSRFSPQSNCVYDSFVSFLKVL